MSKESLTRKQVSRVLSYSPDSGEFRWDVTQNGFAKKGSIAGTIGVGPISYIRITYKGYCYLAHRLAYLYMTGVWPIDHIDHINGDSLDNRWVNLRDVNRVENCRNTKRSARNRSGIVGVSWASDRGKWHARIQGDGHPVGLGYFDSLFDACCVRRSAERQYGYHKNHGR